MRMPIVKNFGPRSFLFLLLFLAVFPDVAFSTDFKEIAYLSEQDQFSHSHNSYETENRLSSNVPLDSWVYPALDKLQGLGLIQSGLQGMRPYTRLEAARQVLETLNNPKSKTLPPFIGELIWRLAVDLHQQLVELGAVPGTPAATYLKPLGGWELRYLEKDGENSSYPGRKPETATNRIEASQDSLNYNNYGINYGDGGNGQLLFESEARFGKQFLLHVQPLLLFRDDLKDGGSDSSLRLLHGTLAFGLGPLELTAGRQSLWWGQGRHGSLVLTNNAEPLDMVRLTNPSPVLLPWVFDILGPFRFDLFLSQLEKDRVVPEPYFGGLRVEFKPLPWLNLGASRTVMFGGEGRPSVGFSDFLTIIGGENLAGTVDTSNSIGALDLRLRIPPLWGAEVYGEMGGEDEADLLGIIPFISNRSFLLGVYLPRVEPTGRVSFRFEYADLSHVDDNSPVWYRHHIYRSGYTYANKILGHHAGGGSEDFYTEIEVMLPYNLTLTLGYDYEKRGADQLVEEQHRQMSFDLRWDFLPQMYCAASWRHDMVENFGYIAGQDEDFYLAELAVGGRF